MSEKKIGVSRVPARYDAKGELTHAERFEIAIVDTDGNGYAFVEITREQADRIRAALEPGAPVINKAIQLPEQAQ